MIGILVSCIRSIHSRKKNRTCFNSLTVNLRTALYRTLITIKRAAHAHSQLGCFGQININIRTYRIFIQLNIIIKKVTGNLFQDTIIPRIRQCYIVTGYTATTAKAHVSAIVSCEIFE